MDQSIRLKYWFFLAFRVIEYRQMKKKYLQSKVGLNCQICVLKKCCRRVLIKRVGFYCFKTHRLVKYVNNRICTTRISQKLQK